jgi:DedD protein
MQRGFGTTFEPAQAERRDRELTLGPFTLTLLGCGLFALCGLCFVFGYAVGHRTPETSTAISVPPAATPAGLTQAANPPSKPAAGQSGEQPPPPADSADTGAVSDSDTSGGAATTSSATTSSANPAAGGVTPAAAAQTTTNGAVQPALPAQSIMVQIAAVAHQEDADVLVGALRKHGYAVNARRDPADGLLHVQIGPFANRNDAWAMRQKLLNDGYNAVVQP